MKNALLALAILLTATLSQAQSMNEEVQIFQNVFGMEKKAAVAEFMEFTDEAEKNAFWTLYDAYETERKELGQRRIAVIVEYAENYDNLTDEKIEALLKESVKVNRELNKLILKYYKKMKKPLGVKRAAQFVQVENYFLSLIRYEVSTQLPFIDELK